MQKVPIQGLTSHKAQVKSLYKRALRNIESYYHERSVFRYNAVLMRARFDANKDVKDTRIANQLVAKGEKELFDLKHPIPKKFWSCPGGAAYQRDVIPPDWVLDYWHPMEKAEYPDYFRNRELMKKEYIKLWEQQYGKYSPTEH